MTMKKNLVGAAIAAAVGVAAPQAAMADIITADWDGLFTMLDSTGAALDNGSLPKGTNRFQTPVNGTIQFDTDTGTGSATLVPFDFFNGSLPAEAVGIEFQAIGDGMGGEGSLVLGNMLFNWNGNTGIPVSIVLDAAGFFGGMQAGLIGDGDLTQAEVAGFGATPASDGTYTNGTYGYLGVGPVPIATTEWNTSFAPGCSLGDCEGVSPSGALPLVEDTDANLNEFAQGDGVGIGGNPMADGPFQGFNANFDITAMTNIQVTPSAIPVPAAVWLFGSGLLGLVGVARRRKA
ncbi:fructose-1-phosphate kinase [Thiohalobacter thiocyanaticus]|uniref:Fructose-1-phosphate kinase n=1 Tax=Thiohalobacter thiocyanaticus TaxID=585455 RepID=A0A1Z4VP45_9GAMM|nr:VPLPA-CTERM sorting domain-containing protein [Thiohalobacter thiocyanaticus]BAZ93192.1 fructose-1-phosphate kinase [Thiohalobacter thiocyanaticus]